MKAQMIHILSDASIRKHLVSFSLPENVIPVREYTALMNAAGTFAKQADEWIEAQNRASLRSNRTMAYILRQLQTPWTPDSVTEWQALREQVLRQPAVASATTCDATWQNMYIQLPEAAYSYRYSEEHDYRDIEIFFSEQKGEKEVSERSAHLDDLMRIEMLWTLFTKSGWATRFPKSECILTPPIFNNIYKMVSNIFCILPNGSTSSTFQARRTISKFRNHYNFRKLFSRRDNYFNILHSLLKLIIKIITFTQQHYGIFNSQSSLHKP